ncbi:MAG TPA: ATP-binding cassette domain-containing protein [Candidatus Eisenbergiella merdavium]|uniref:ATP-binding cassette domain-containing protein n=1 Tax=Candidatus Eisenbergiella merdavium TaxID=2838551 RepID=A0A9D2NJD7_9FIRM|nr:ATP-binding cassette domain-containing protein [Candidatus Eisenbergiella merdavium]
MKTGSRRIQNCTSFLAFLLALSGLAAGWFTVGLSVRAEDASVVYGSEEYTPQAEEEFNIGLYIRCDAPDFVYTVAMSYDPARMEYLGGADSAENGMLRFAGEASGGERRYMLTFRALTEGACAVSVTEAAVITDPSAGIVAEEGEMGAGMAEDLAAQTAPPSVASITALGTAAVRISPPVDCSLSALSIEELPDFALEPDVYEYDLTVSPNTQELGLSASVSDERAAVSISDTDLETGENTITVTVRGGKESREYLLHVTRPEAERQEEGVETGETVGTEPGILLPAEDTLDAEGGMEQNASLPTNEEAPDAVAVMAQPAEENGGSGLFSLLHFRYLLLGGGILLLAAAGGLAFLLWKRKQRDRYFDDEDDEMEWLNLNEDEAWIQWLSEVEEAEEEMTEIETRQPIQKAAQKPAAAAPEAGAQQPPVIRIEDVSMRFKISEVNAGSLKEYLLVTLKRQNRYHELEALRHITFDIHKGEVIGIIGTNGSGKSTLLKLIAGVLKPSEGNIEVDRKKVQLLTLGTGFDAELTARENVYLNGAIIGYSREFIDENFDRIVKFAELDGFMDEKIKNFSSGMMSRLGFAIATVGETAEILILDEVLSVGDMFFRKKSEQRIKEMIHSGSTVLIVSHSTDTIIKNCTKAVWIEKGVLKEIGEPKKVCAAYRKLAG